MVAANIIAVTRRSELLKRMFDSVLTFFGGLVFVVVKPALI